MQTRTTKTYFQIAKVQLILCKDKIYIKNAKIFMAEKELRGHPENNGN